MTVRPAGASTYWLPPTVGEARKVWAAAAGGLSTLIHAVGEARKLWADAAAAKAVANRRVRRACFIKEWEAHGCGD